MSTVRYKLPYPPSTNALYANVPGKGRVKTARYRTWLRAAGNEILAQQRVRIDGQVHLTITLTPRPGTNPDASNSIKALEDLLVTMEVIEDDNRRIVRRLIVKWDDDEDTEAMPGAVIEVCEAA